MATVARIQRVVVDDKATFERVCNFVDTFVPQLRNRVALYENEIPLLDAYGVEIEISRALEKKDKADGPHGCGKYIYPWTDGSRVMQGAVSNEKLSRGNFSAKRY